MRGTQCAGRRAEALIAVSGRTNLVDHTANGDAWPPGTFFLYQKRHESRSAQDSGEMARDHSAARNLLNTT